MEEFNNKTYFTLKEASKLFGYSPDYLGFLVRKRKIKGKRTYNIRWQITKKELLTYCKERKKKIKKPHLFNKKLTLKQASRISGYSPDYIGQLLRTEKLKGKRIKTQVSWLVEKQNIENYRDGRDERQSNTRKPLRFSFIKIRRKQIVLIGRRLFASTFVLIYFISGIAPTDFLLASIGAFFIEEPKTINLYSQLAEGDWQNLQNSQGPPDLSPNKDISSFSESNSAVYQTGSLSLVLKDFTTDQELTNHLFNSAQIKISFAIGEKEIDLSVIEELEQETTTSTEEQTSFWNEVKQFFNYLLTRIKSIVFKALSIAKAKEEQIQGPQEPERLDEPQEPEEIEENPPAEEEGQSTIGEDEENILNQDTWLDEIIEETEEPSDAEAMEGEAEESEEGIEEPGGELTEQESEEEEQPPEETPAEEQVEEGEGVQEDEPTEEESEETITTTTESIIDQTTTTEIEATTTEEIEEIQEPEETEQALPEPDPDILPNLDAKIIIYWSLDGEDWQILDTISSYPLSNHLNNGYFTYQASFLTDWQDINNLQIKLEGVIGGQTNIISYLDSIWIEAEHEEQAEEETEEVLAPDDEGQAPPTEEEQPTDEGGGGGGGDEESPLDQDTWLDEIIEESEEEEQPPEETEETPAPSDEGEDEEQTEEEEQPSDDESTEGEEGEETEEPKELEEKPEEEPEEDSEEEPEEKDLEEEPEESIKKLRKLKIKDKDLIFSFQKKDFTSNEEPFFIISTPDLTIEELLNTDKAEEISEGEEDEELPEVEPIATSTIATSTEELATTTKEIEEEPEEIEEEEEEEEEEVVEEESEEEIIVTTTTEPIIEQTTTTEATTTEEMQEPEEESEEEPEEIEEEEEEVEEEPPVEETPPEESEEEELTEEEPSDVETMEGEALPSPEASEGEAEEQPEEESEDLTLLEKIKIFFENIILVLKQGIEKIVSIIIKIVRQNIPSVKAQSADNLKLTIIQPNGKESSLTPQITATYINGKEVFEVKLQKPETGLQPGLYKLQIELETPEAIFISEQEFTWGVLAINVNKSIYTPGEQTYLQMAALNEWGHTLCDANLELKIKHLQSGAQVRLSTLHNTIKKSGECGPNNIVDVPDYYAYYQVKGPGKYEMILKNLDTGYEITDYFEAQNSVLFDVERIGPTRIWPWTPYQMILKVKANQDFEGEIIESVPQGFDVQIQDTNYKILDTNETEKQIIWDVTLTQGDELDISYTFDAPDVSPYLFLLGPLTFTTQQTAEVGPLATTTNATGSEELLEAPSDQNGTTTTLESFTFQESRKWQLASDAATLNQHSFIFENDDATDVNSNSNMESANATATDIKKGQRFIARFQLDNIGDPSTTTFKLQYDKTDDRWIDVGFGGAPNINSWASSSDWNATTVISSAGTGRRASIAIGSDGNPVIAYYDTNKDWLNVIKCGNPSCTSGNTNSNGVDTSADWTVLVGQTSIAVGVDGNPVISYHDNANASLKSALKFAKCTDLSCSSKNLVEIDTNELSNIAQDPSIAISTSGEPIIAYDGYTDLNFARCTSGDCTSANNWSTTTVDEVGDVGKYSSIAIGTDGYPVISYYNNTLDNLNFARCTSGNCTQQNNWSTTTVDEVGDVGKYSSIAIGTDGYPVISYWDADLDNLNLAKCTSGNCTQKSDWSTTTVDSEGYVGKFTSLAIGTDGNPVISYYDGTNESLKFAKCRNSACSSVATSSNIIIFVDSVGASTTLALFNSLTALTISNDGWPVISYYKDSDQLKVAKMRPLVEIQPAWGLSGTSSTPLTSNEAGDCAGGTNWTDGQWYEATTTSNAIPLDTNKCTELAFVLDTVEATASTTYRLRLVEEDGTPLDVYTELPALKIVKETENTLRYSKEAVLTSASSCGGTTEYGCTKITYGSDDVGRYPSLAIGTDGYPVIAHANSAGTDSLMVTKCSSADCTSIATTTKITYGSDDVGVSPSLAIGTDGYPVIAHKNSAGTDSLMVTKCSSADCTSIATTTKITYGSDNVGNNPFIAISADGYPVIAHINSAIPYSLMVTKCSSADCTSIATTTKITYGSDNVGNNPSIAISADGYPVIAHANSAGTYSLMVTKCSSADCTSIATTTKITYGSDNVGNNPSIAISADGYPVIAHANSAGTDSLMVTKCSSADCTSIATTTKITYGSDDVGNNPFIAISADGYPVIAHINSAIPNSLMVTKCSSADCTSIATTTKITYGSDHVGVSSSLAIGTDGYPVIAHTNWSAGTYSLMVTKQLGLPKTAISYFNRYIKTDAQIKISRNMLSGTISEGPNNPETVVDNSSVGTVAWSNPTRATSSDNNHASCSIPSYATSHYLKATDFGFSIPGGATIQGIEADIERSCSEVGGIYDSGIMIVKGGVIGNTNRGDGLSLWPTSDDYATYGSSIDLWGESWSYSDINASDFGIVVSAHSMAATQRTVYVDHIRITVYYKIPALYLESSPAIEDGLLYKFDKADYTSSQTSGDSSFSNVTSTGGTSTSTPMFVFTDKFSDNTQPLYAKWQGQSTLQASSKSIVLQVFRFGNSSNTTGWVTTTEETSCSADSDCVVLGSTTTDLTDFYYPEYKFNDSTGTTSADYWVFWRVYQEEATGSLSPPTLKTDFWVSQNESMGVRQRAYVFENDDGNTVNDNSDMSATNTTTTDLKKGQRFVARFQIDNDGSAATNTYKLQYDKQDNQWIDIDYGGAPNINTGASSSDWNVTTVDSTGNVGYTPSIAIGTDGFPVIAHLDATLNAVIVVKCGNPSCTSGNTTSSVDTGLGSYGGVPSIAIGTDGFPVISYFDDTNDCLSFAKCGNHACSSGNTTTTVDSLVSAANHYISLAIGTDGFPVISYYEGNNDNLNFAKCIAGDSYSIH